MWHACISARWCVIIMCSHVRFSKMNAVVVVVAIWACVCVYGWVLACTCTRVYMWGKSLYSYIHIALRQPERISFDCMRACHYNTFLSLFECCPTVCLRMCLFWLVGWLDLLVHSLAKSTAWIYHVAECVCVCVLLADTCVSVVFFQSAVRLLTTSLLCQIPKYTLRYCCCWCFDCWWCYCCCCRDMYYVLCNIWEKIQLGWQIETTNSWANIPHSTDTFDLVGIWFVRNFNLIFSEMSAGVREEKNYTKRQGTSRELKISTCILTIA